MFGKRLKLFTLFGFTVRIDLSWLLLGALIAFSLAEGLFPYTFPGLSPGTYWLMAVIGILGLAFSIVFHEFCHAMVARYYGMPIAGITLFLFGGVAEMKDEPPSAKSEFLMAIAGPIASALLALLFIRIWFWREALSLPNVAAGAALYLGYLNLLLAMFNLIPAFPLDGGRVLRSALWAIRGDLHWATRWSSRIGVGFGWALVGLGIVSVLYGNVVGGIWWILIGFFLRTAARSSYEQLLLRDNLRKVPVSRVMDPRPMAVSPSDTVETLMRGLAAMPSQSLVPVVQDGHLVGCIEADKMRRLPRATWQEHAAAEYATACPIDPEVTPDSSAERAFASMASRGYPLLVVTVGDRLEGLLAFTDMLRAARDGHDDGRYWRA